MENRTNQIIELNNNKKYLILRQVVYKNDTYYVTCEIFDNDDFKKELTILKETIEEKDYFVNIVNDKDVVNIILKNIE